jgi:hypothetical protein
MRNICTLIGGLLLALNLSAQTLVVGGSTGNGDFENGSSGWTLVNGSQVNKWVVGSNATAGFSGAGSVYISNDPSGAVHRYDTTATSVVYFYKDIAIPADVRSLWVQFDYICAGEPGSGRPVDGLQVQLQSTNVGVTGGVDNGSNTPGFYSAYAGTGTWQRGVIAPFIFVQGYGGSTARLIFQWKNNNVGGTQPPAAIDNIKVYYSCQNELRLSTSGVESRQAYLSWYYVAAGGYQLRYRKVSEPETVSTYANPLTISGTSYVLGGLQPGTDYQVEVRSLGSTCSQYDVPLRFSTLPVPDNDDCSGAISIPVTSAPGAGVAGTFMGTTGTSGMSNSCSFSGSSAGDVWYRFQAAGASQTIQASADGSDLEAGIFVYSGSCSNLQLVTNTCATFGPSRTHGAYVSRLALTGLVTGTTYYVRVSRGNSIVNNFRMQVFNPPAQPGCVQQLEPANSSIINYKMAQTFRWTAATNAKGYLFRLGDPAGTFTGNYQDFYSTDTFFVYTPQQGGQDITWSIRPLNFLDEMAPLCGSRVVSTCATTSNAVTVQGAATSSMCSGDSLLLRASAANPGLNWFRDGQLLTGSTADSLRVAAGGVYSIRLANGACYSDPSNTVTVTLLPRPTKPPVTITGTLSFCAGGSVSFSTPWNVQYNRQWYRNGQPLAGTSESYVAQQSGAYSVRATDPGTGCFNHSDTLVVTSVPLLPVPAITQNSNLLSVTTGYAYYQWFLNGTAIAGANAAQFAAATNGSYRVDVGNSATCITSSSAFTFTSTAVSTVDVDGAQVRFYPNPVRDILTVNVEGNRSARSLPLRIVDAQGRTVKTAFLKAGRNTVLVADISAGIYHAVMQTGKGAKTVRILKVK